MKVLVTGINGFVGKYLADELLSHEHGLVGIDITQGDLVRHECDLGDYDSLEKLVMSETPDAVVHLAGIARVDFENPDRIYQINFNGTLNLLKACSKLEIKPRIILISSSQVYGVVPEEQLPISEKNSVFSVNHYGASKAACEQLLYAFGSEYNIPYIIARPFNHTGPGQSLDFVIPKIVSHFKNQRATIELGNTWPLRDFLDVRDVVRAYRLMVESELSGKVYNICRGSCYSIDEIIRALEEITDHTIDVAHVEKFIRKNEIPKVLGDFSCINSDLGWEPLVELKTTLTDMLNE